MISAALLEKVACPVCLVPSGCPACARPRADHAACASEYAARARCACGGPDKVRVEARGDALRCPCCGEAYPVRKAEGYVDLVPRADVGEVTQYADHEFHERLQVTDTPPVLSARIKADMMRRMLRPEAGQAVLDLGCGPGKMALYAGSNGAAAAGLDVAPFFLPRAAREVDLVLGDLRRLPFRKGAFPRAFSLDVLEHLDEEDVKRVLVEARRVLGEDGGFFVYTHVMESGVLGPFQRGVKRLARGLGRLGLLDYEREAMRKSDHKNALRSHEHFDALCVEAGLRVAERRYYNVFFKAVVEDILFKIYEHARNRFRGAGREDRGRGEGAGEARAVGASRPGGVPLLLGRALTWLLELDVLLFSGMRTGPFFGLLRPVPRSSGSRAGA